MFTVFSLQGAVFIDNIATSKNYQAMDESSSQDKLIVDNFGNLYTPFVIRFNQFDNVFVYTSVNEGYSWHPLDPDGPIDILTYDQKFPTLAIDNKNGILYSFWVGADDDHTGTFYFEEYDKDQFGDLQLKFAYYYNGKWSDWKNIAEVSGYDIWEASPNLNTNVYAYNPVIGGKLKVVKYYQLYPSAAIDSSGNVYVVWSGPDAVFTGYQIKFTKSEDLGNMSLGEFYNIFEMFLNEIMKRKIKIIVIVISPTQYKNNFVFEDHIFKFHEMLSTKYFIEMRRILPYSIQQYKPQIVEKAKEKNKCLNLIRDLVVWRLKK